MQVSSYVDGYVLRAKLGQVVSCSYAVHSVSPVSAFLTPHFPYTRDTSRRC